MSSELSALLATLEGTSPSALTSCPGWTAHHLAAHIAGNYEEVRRHVDAFSEGRPLVRTRTWDEREASLRALDYGILVRRIEREGEATSLAVGEVLKDRPDAELIWTGRTVPVSGFLTHMRSEDALHRWDLVGDDEVSMGLLSQIELLHHAVSFIGGPLSRRGLDAGAGAKSFTGRIRCVDLPDLIVEVTDNDAELSIGPVAGAATIEGDPAARLLLLWGRKATPFTRLHSVDDEEASSRVQRLLSGY